MDIKHVIALFFAALIGAVLACSPFERTADLSSVVSDVSRYDSGDAKSYSVPAGQTAKLVKGDGVNVDNKGIANLKMGGCTLRIYRSSGLQVTGLSWEVYWVYYPQDIF